MSPTYRRVGFTANRTTATQFLPFYSFTKPKKMTEEDCKDLDCEALILIQLYPFDKVFFSVDEEETVLGLWKNLEIT